MWFTLLLTLFLGSTSLRAQVQVEQHADTTAILIGERSEGTSNYNSQSDRWGKP